MNVPHAANSPPRGTLIKPTPTSDTLAVVNKISVLDLLSFSQICFMTKPLVMIMIADVMTTVTSNAIACGTEKTCMFLAVKFSIMKYF